MEEIAFEDFGKVRLLAARILSAKPHPDADRLLLLQVDCGEEEPRQVVAGIAEAFAPESLTDRRICLVANLKPATIRGQLSQGMLLAAGKGKKLQLLDPGEVRPGTAIG